MNDTVGTSYIASIGDLDTPDFIALYPDLLATVRELFPFENGNTHERICNLVISTCGSCKTAPTTCECWNDE